MKIKVFSCNLLASFILILSVCSGCNKISYPFRYDESEIENIAITYTLEEYGETHYKYETLVKITDNESFLNKFKEIEFGRYIFGDPTHISENEYAILITYFNGDYEFINCYAQDIFVDESLYYGMVNCDEEDFNNIIKFYLNDST